MCICLCLLFYCFFVRLFDCYLLSGRAFVRISRGGSTVAVRSRGYFTCVPDSNVYKESYRSIDRDRQTGIEFTKDEQGQARRGEGRARTSKRGR